MTFASNLLLLTVSFANSIINGLFYVLFAYVILSWLYAFGVVSYRNKFFKTINDVCAALIEPMTGKLRKVFPFLTVGPIDLSVIALYFILHVIQLALYSLVM
jgi:YggT family protein